MSETPRTDEKMVHVSVNRDGSIMLWPNESGGYVDANFCRTLERENAQLRTELESHAWEVSPAMAHAKIDQLNAEVESLRKGSATACAALRAGANKLDRQNEELKIEAGNLAADVERLIAAEVERLKSTRWKYADDPEMVFTDYLGWLHAMERLKAEVSKHSRELVRHHKLAMQGARTWLHAQHGELIAEVERLRKNAGNVSAELVNETCDAIRWQQRAERAEEENKFLHDALDAFEWQRINSMTVAEVKKELLANGYTEERLAAGFKKIIATVEKAKAALDAAKGGAK